MRQRVMRRAYFVLLIASSLGCSPFRIPEDLREVAGSGDVDEDSRSLTHGLTQRLESLVIAGAEPGRILELTEFFFEHYPFSQRDLALSDEEVIFTIAKVHAVASQKLKPATPVCGRIKSTQVVNEVLSILEKESDRHDDGDRCVWEVIVRLGNARKNASPKDAWRLWEALLPHVRSSPLIVPLAMRVEGIIARSTLSQIPTWSRFEGAFIPGRWKRIYLCYRQGEIQYLDQGLSQPAVTEFAAEFSHSKLDPDLAEHGRRLFMLLTGLGRLRRGDWKAVDDVCAADEWMQSHLGGFLMDQEVRLATVCALLEVKQVDRARAKASYDGDKELANSRHSRVGTQEAVAVASKLMPLRSPEEIIEHVKRLTAEGKDETGEALIILATAHQLMGREGAMTAVLHAVDDVAATHDFEQRSRARRWLGRHYATRMEWKKAVVEWTEWKPWHWCGSCRWDLDAQREIMIKYCDSMATR